MKKATKIISAIIMMTAVLVSDSTFAQKKKTAPVSPVLMNANTLKMDMRKLWEEHITWTRNVILCLVDDLPGKDQALTRLLQNQGDLGNAIKPYYGEEAGKKLTELLAIHINISAEVILAAKKGDAVALDAANKRWFANADDISKFLSDANPNWKMADMKLMMDDHLKYTTEEAMDRIQKNYNADIIAYDKVHTEILEMADMLADGIVKQFPEKFKASPKLAAQ